MEPRKNSNTIPVIHPVISMQKGENYWFNGCAAYVMECLHEPDYTYGFFAGLTGDNFTQIYYKDTFRGDSATDHIVRDQGGAYIQGLFEKIGYACSYVTNRSLQENRVAYLQQLMDSINRGVPVIRYHWFWSVIVGYEDAGETLLVLMAEQAEPEKIKFDALFELSDKTSDREAVQNGYGWFFVGDKQREVALQTVYREAIQDLLPRLSVDNERYCFGAAAFRAWAKDIEDGKYDQMKPEAFDDWPLYTCFVCNLATNSGCGREFLIQALQLNPDLIFLSEVMRLFRRTGDLWRNQGGEDLESIGGGFNITLEALQTPETRSKICAKLRDFAHCTDRIMELLRENTDETGVLRPVMQDLAQDTGVQYTKTVNTTDWIPSPFVPAFSGKIADLPDKTGEKVSCWQIDSRKGRWSTVYSTLEGVKAGEQVRLLLWAKFTGGGSHELIVWITQSDWNKHAEFYMNECKPYLLGKQGDYGLFAAVYTAVEDGTVQFSVSVNDVVVSLYPASAAELMQYAQAELPKRSHGSIVRCVKEPFPRSRFVGIKYKNSDRVDGNFGPYWGEWHSKNRFAQLEQLLTDSFRQEYPDSDAYIGLMRDKYGTGDDYFEYWIGMFLPPDCAVPAGYDFLDFTHDTVGVCWVQGREDEVFFHEGDCYQAIVQNGMQGVAEEDGGCYFFERYGCPRYTTSNEAGEIILDIGHFVEK